jgi:hypothetical protein
MTMLQFPSPRSKKAIGDWLHMKEASLGEMQFQV